MIDEQPNPDDVDDEFDRLATICQSHTAEWDRDCEYCQESANLCMGLYKTVANRVTALEHKMMQEGAMIGNDMVVAVKIEVLVNLLLGNKGRAYFDYLFQARMANEYENLLQQLSRMKLMQGVQAPGGGKKL